MRPLRAVEQRLRLVSAPPSPIAFREDSARGMFGRGIEKNVYSFIPLPNIPLPLPLFDLPPRIGCGLPLCVLRASARVPGVGD